MAISESRILTIMNSKEYVQAGRDEKFQLLKQYYEYAIEKKFMKRWKQNWDKSVPFVYELLDMEFKLTRLLISETTRGSKQILNLEKVNHNPEIFKQLMILMSLWENYFALESGHLGFKHNSAIDESVKLFYEERPEIKEKSNEKVIEDIKVQYLNVYWCCQIVQNKGGVNLRTKTLAIDALVY